MLKIELKNRLNGKKCAVKVDQKALEGVSVYNEPYEVAHRLEDPEFRKMWIHLGLNVSWERNRCLEVVGCWCLIRIAKIEVFRCPI